ncbi:LuxR C-terminal-related transcriptional regulator [Chloroflexota bacterium]
MPVWASVQFSAWQARLWLAQGKLELAAQWAAERTLPPDNELVFLHEVEDVALARILVAQGKLEEATGLLKRLYEVAALGGRTARMIEVLNLQALSSQASNDIPQALVNLEKALLLAEPGGFIRAFVDEGPPLAQLLYEALTNGIKVDYVGRLLAAFPVSEQTLTSPSKTQVPEFNMVEPLSERELEVLHLVAEGLTNPEIAAKLFISLNTVKVHTRNINSKLDTHNRTQAVAKARTLGILTTA